MAIVGESGDKMRDIIANAAAELTTDGDGAEGVSDGADSAEPEVVDAGAVDNSGGGGSDDDQAVVEPVAAGAGAGAAGDVVDPEAAAPAAVGAEGAAGTAVKAGEEAGKGKAKAADEHPFAKEHGIKSKDSLGRENKIPFNRVLKINENSNKKAVAAAETKWTAEKLAPVTKERDVYRERLGKIKETEDIMFGQPRRYIAMLQSIPGYKELFNEISGGKFTGEGETGAKPGVGTDIADPMPTPDAKDEKGNVVGWTQDGIEKRFAWERRQASRDTLTEVEKKFKPIQDRFAAVTANEETTGNIDGIIDLASAWPGFKDNYVPILDELSRGTDKLDTPQKMYAAVQSAYNTVMYGFAGKQKETEEQTRARLFAEFQAQLKAAPRSTAARTTVARREPAATDPNAALNPDDRMRNIIADSLKKNGLL